MTLDQKIKEMTSNLIKSGMWNETQARQLAWVIFFSSLETNVKEMSLPPMPVKYGFICGTCSIVLIEDNPDVGNGFIAEHRTHDTHFYQMMEL